MCRRSADISVYNGICIIICGRACVYESPSIASAAVKQLKELPGRMVLRRACLLKP